MAERSFTKEVQTLRLGDGDEFRGEGILAVTKALLQSGVSYVAGYTGLGVGTSRFGAEVALDLLDGIDSPATRLSMVRRKISGCWGNGALPSATWSR